MPQDQLQVVQEALEDLQAALRVAETAQQGLEVALRQALLAVALVLRLKELKRLEAEGSASLEPPPELSDPR